MNKKPNQVIDEITDVIFPPAEAISPQLYAIRQNALSAVNVYESTEDIHSIFPNLDAMQHIINYLQGAPMQDELRPIPDDELNPVFVPAAAGFNVTTNIDRNGNYNVTIVGIDVEPKINNVDLFGEVENVVEMELDIPVICGKTYTITQNNPALALYYPSDAYIIEQETEDGKIEYIKSKDYLMEEDSLQFSFLLMEGRTKVKIEILMEGENEKPVIFTITSHIHFKEPEETPEVTPDEDTSSNG